MAQQSPPPAVPPLPHPELPDPSAITLGPPWWLYAGAILLVCVLLSLVIWLLFRAKKAVPPQAPRPWNRAMDSLHDLRGRTEAQPHAETAHQVSEVLRNYFWERYQIPAPFRTRRELFEQEAPKMTQRVDRYAPLAALWDELSFAPIPVSREEALALVDRAIANLQEDRP
ncbi:MAG: DUF4381 family protein [Prosthecobacter sp.]|nr:DUF4381 family protein [Prosthecobacter sp.]